MRRRSNAGRTHPVPLLCTSWASWFPHSTLSLCRGCVCGNGLCFRNVSVWPQSTSPEECQLATHQAIHLWMCVDLWETKVQVCPIQEKTVPHWAYHVTIKHREFLGALASEAPKTHASNPRVWDRQDLNSAGIAPWEKGSSSGWQLVH